MLWAAVVLVQAVDDWDRWVELMTVMLALGMGPGTGRAANTAVAWEAGLEMEAETGMGMVVDATSATHESRTAMHALQSRYPLGCTNVESFNVSTALCQCRDENCDNMEP